MRKVVLSFSQKKDIYILKNIKGGFLIYEIKKDCTKEIL